MSILFEPYCIGSMEIRNRFMRSATTSAWSDDRGVVRPEIIRLYRNLAKGGVGLIVKGHTYVTDAGKAHLGMAGISHDYHVTKLQELTEAVHNHGGKIVTQLNHAGYKSIIDRAGPSEYSEAGWKARSISIKEIHEIIEAFGDAAQRTKDAGFDGVMIHAAHGYLVSQFLSRLANKRTDEYGGRFENRIRILKELYYEIRNRVGKSYPILIKMNCDDFSPDGFTLKDSLCAADTLSKGGIDLIEISGGGIGQIQEIRRTRAKSKDPDISEAKFAGHAAKIRETITPTPLALVNGIRSRQCMENLVKKGVADIISMSRPFIKEPNLVRNLETSQLEATCITCDDCSSQNFFGKMMLSCHQG